jgi:hypothetical protein
VQNSSAFSGVRNLMESHASPYDLVESHERPCGMADERCSWDGKACQRRFTEPFYLEKSRGITWAAFWQDIVQLLQYVMHLRGQRGTSSFASLGKSALHIPLGPPPHPPAPRGLQGLFPPKFPFKLSFRPLPTPISISSPTFRPLSTPL